MGAFGSASRADGYLVGAPKSEACLVGWLVPCQDKARIVEFGGLRTGGQLFSPMNVLNLTLHAKKIGVYLFRKSSLQAAFRYTRASLQARAACAERAPAPIRIHILPG